MKERQDLVPESMRRMVVLTLTLVAVLLYAAILITAILNMMHEANPQFSETMERAAGLLSGLVGAVVTAGFARSPAPVQSPVTVPHPMGGPVPTAWKRLRPASLAARNLEGLGQFLGLPGIPTIAPSVPPRADVGAEPELPADESLPTGFTPRMWVALVYVFVYMTVGLAAFVFAVWLPDAPSLVANAAWVWFGTVVSAAYSFFGLNTVV